MMMVDAMLQTRDLGTKRYPPSRANEARGDEPGPGGVHVALAQMLARPLKCEHEQPLLRVPGTYFLPGPGAKAALPFPPSLPSDAPSAPRSKHHATATKRERSSEHGPGGELRRSLRRQRLEWRRAQAANHAGTKRTTNTGNKEKRTARVGREDEKLLREAASKGNKSSPVFV